MRTNIHFAFNTLVPKLTYKLGKSIKVAKQERSKEYFNKCAISRENHVLQGSQSCLKHFLPSWTLRAVVNKEFDWPRSYLVESDQGNQYVMNEYAKIQRGEKHSFEVMNEVITPKE